MAKAILFDLGDTVFHPSWMLMNEKMVEETGMPILMSEDIMKRYKEEVLTGKTKMEVIFDLILKEINSNKDVDEIIKVYKKNYEVYAPINEKMIELIKKLGEKFKIFALSNTNDIHKEVNMKRGLFDNFDEAFLSFEMGLSKPDRKIFSVILKKTELRPEDIVFIDDNEENIENAIDMGFIGIKYETYDKLINRLRELGLD